MGTKDFCMNYGVLWIDACSEGNIMYRVHCVVCHDEWRELGEGCTVQGTGCVVRHDGCTMRKGGKSVSLRYMV